MKGFKIMLIVLLTIGAIFLIFGHVETYNDFTITTIEKEYMGQGCVQEMRKAQKLTADFLPDGEILLNKDNISIDGLEGETVDVYMDFCYVQTHYEKRTILTGKLLEETETYAYRPTDAYLEKANAEEKHSTFDHTMIQWP